ncbi:YdcF family protein [Paenibacillus chitinolyticus]|uniref:YdcF family protein n=1 Tax=Paenibacillus chitinolyticus TaxID=79263 RepID=UPI003867835A
MTKKQIKLILAFGLFVVLMIAVKNAGSFLVYTEEPVKSDVILVLSGDRGERTEKGAELYKNGVAPYLMFSGGEVYRNSRMADLMKEHAMELGVPEQAIVLEDRADSTYENAVFSKKVIEKHAFKSVTVVSSDYHMRRVKLLFDRAFKDSGIRLHYAAAPDKNFTPRKWWGNNKSLMVTFTEYLKLTGYFFGKNS